MKIFSHTKGFSNICSQLRTSHIPNIEIWKRHYPAALKRFYQNVTVAGTSQSFEINLDHKKLKTPSGNIFQVPSYALALAISNEWSSVDKNIIPSWMHLTSMSNTILDNPQKLTLQDVVSKTIEYFETDTVLFRDETTEDFVNLQAKEWDPILEWFNSRFVVDLEPSTGIFPPEVSSETKEKLQKYFLAYNYWAASGILFGVEALKSVILTVATLERKILPEQAVHLSRLETEFQTEKWGTVDWAHTVDECDILSRFSAAVLFAHMNSSSYITKQKGVQR